MTYGNGDYNTFTYDKYGNVATIGVNGTTTFKNYSDTSGNVVRNEDTRNKLLYNYDYDSTSRLIRSSVMDTSLSASAQRNIYATEYGYDLNNNVNKVVNKAGTKTLTTQYTYSKDNHNTLVTLPSSKTVSYTYDSLARLGNYQFNTTTPFKVAYGYYTSQNRNNDGGEVYRSTRVSTETIGSDVYKYTYDKLGNITKIQHKPSGGSYSDVVSYVYDSLGQLVRENNALEYKTRVYNYDNGGNITSEEEHTYNTGELGTPAYVTEYGYTDTTWKDKLTSYDGEEITYDEIGNPTIYRGYTLNWSNGRELTSLTGRGHNITYTYDASGLRLSKTVGGETTTFEYVDGLLMYEKKGDTEVHYAYDGDGNPRYIQTVDAYGTVEEGYLVTNTRGDVVAIVDNAGNIVVKYTYDAWGNELSVTNASGEDISNVSGLGYYNSLRYRGYYYDGETCLYYLQSRYYNPQVKRFINADDVSVLEEDQGSIIEHNLFAYCLNNSVNMGDKEGDVAGALALGGVLYTVAGILCSPVTITVVGIVTVIYVGGKYYKVRNVKKSKKSSSIKASKKKKTSKKTSKKNKPEGHRTTKNGSKKKTNDKHTKKRAGSQKDKAKQKSTWVYRGNKKKGPKDLTP